MAKKALVASGNAFQVFQAVFFSFPAKKDTVSHHVKARDTKRARAFSDPKS
jgi:hypothetical protein